jgi:hypothetical protein
LQCAHGRGVRPDAYSWTKFELPLEVQNIVRDVEGRGHAPRVVKVIERAAAAERPVPVGLVIELHRYTDDLVALLDEQRRRHR